MAGNKNSGRRPTPNAIKALTGNPGKRPINEREPQPEPIDGARLPAAPANLSRDARAFWRVLTTQLAAVRVLTVLDLPMLEVLTIHLGRHRALSTRLRDAEAGDSTSVEIPTLLRELRREAVIVRGLAASFGLSPSERTRLHAAPAEPTPSALLRLINRKRT